jgi:hypothetical protein
MTRLLPLARRARTAAPDADAALVDRFSRHADPAAFAEIVRRHGPMVLGVCQRATRDPHLADDAFQATFLVLARRAGALRDPGGLEQFRIQSGAELSGRIPSAATPEGAADEDPARGVPLPGHPAHRGGVHDDRGG